MHIYVKFLTRADGMANGMRRVGWIFGGALAAGLVAAAALSGYPPAQAQAPAGKPSVDQAREIAAGDTAKQLGPRQPIYFRHDIHSGQYKMQCQYCHYSVAVSNEPGIPSMKTCMGCHLVIAGNGDGNKAEIKKLRAAWNEKKPVEWVRIHYLARHAHFPHSRHVKAMGPNACATCHGDVSRMPQVYKVNNINNMGWCITCHVERKVTRDCSACHY